MTKLSEDVVVSEADVLASQIVSWFRERLRVAETRLTASEDQRVAADDERDAADQHVIELEELLAASQELTEQLQHALESRVVIEQAKGILAERLGSTPQAAFEVIRSHARSNGRVLREVAQEVISGTLRIGGAPGV